MIYLDLDQTIVDLNAGYLQVTGNEFTQKRYNSMSKWEFWEPTFFDGFWRNLPKTNWADKLLEVAFSTDIPVGVLSAAITNCTSWCIKEKYEWVRENLPQIERQNIHIVPYKEDKAKFAKNSDGLQNILVDDRVDTCFLFSQHGGISFRINNDFPWIGINYLQDILQHSMLKGKYQ